MEHVGPKSTKQGMSTRPWPGRNAPTGAGGPWLLLQQSDSLALPLTKVVRKEKLKHFDKATQSWSLAGRWRRLLVGCGHDVRGGAPRQGGSQAGHWPGLRFTEGLKVLILAGAPQASAEEGKGQGLGAVESRAKLFLLRLACGGHGHPCHCPDAG